MCSRPLEKEHHHGAWEGPSKCDPRSGQSGANWSPGLQTEVRAKARSPGGIIQVGNGEN